MRTRPNAFSTKGVVASSSQIASIAGAKIAAQGGNVADVAIATSSVLCVTQNNLCGLGGDLFALIRMNDKEVIDLNASGRAFEQA
ncbi:Gamma-glutamyltranspeptidase, partial [mine drainage metagenome]